MKVSNETIEELVIIINDSLGRTGNELVRYFNQFGFNHTYPEIVHEAGSKAKYTRHTLNSVNGSIKLDTIIEYTVHPRQYINSPINVQDMVNKLNQLLAYDGYELIQSGNVFSIKYNNQQQSGTVKNLIFASDGPKPDLVLKDTLTYEIEVVTNQQHILIYDQPISADGINWDELKTWWSNKYNIFQNQDNLFYNRLYQSLGSPPEELFFRTYYEIHNPTLYNNVPALIPQIYLHYDPYTLKQLNGGSRIPRQRMDFLLLLPGNNKVVIEIDGKQHYTKDNSNESSPKNYSKMVSEDRNLKLKGYELYRFGGYELKANNTYQLAQAKKIINDFFKQLFTKHQINIVPINTSPTP